MANGEQQRLKDKTVEEAFGEIKKYILPGTGVSIILGLVVFIFLGLQANVKANGEAIKGKASKIEVIDSVSLMLDKRDVEHKAYQEDIKELKEKQVKLQEQQINLQMQQRVQPYPSQHVYQPPPVKTVTVTGVQPTNTVVANKPEILKADGKVQDDEVVFKAILSIQHEGIRQRALEAWLKIQETRVTK